MISTRDPSPLQLAFLIVALALLVACGGGPPAIPQAASPPSTQAVGSPSTPGVAPSTVASVTSITASTTNAPERAGAASAIAPVETADAAVTQPAVRTALVGSAVVTETPGAAETKGVPGQNGYLDDRSTPRTLIMSYYNAVNRKEYARAYGYWEAPGSVAGQPPAFPQFRQGYANTAVVRLTTGTAIGNAGAGQVYYTLPVTLKAQTTSGVTQTFVGCYTLHLSQPGIQTDPPFHPLGIAAAKLRQVPNDANTGVLMAESCR